jgi:hypothetical protein
MEDINIFIPSYHRPDNIRTAKYFVKKGWQPDKIHVFIASEGSRSKAGRLRELG